VVADIEIDGATLVVHIRGADRFWALARDVHDPSKAIAIRLHDERYSRLVIGVEDPQATAAAINAALGRS